MRFKKSLLAAVLVAQSSTVAAQSPLGHWLRGDGNARVRIAECGESFCATNTWVRNPGSERVGHVLVLKVRKLAASFWKGSAYDPQRKLNLSMQMTVGVWSMTTNGCILGGLLCRTVSWKRLK